MVVVYTKNLSISVKKLLPEIPSISEVNLVYHDKMAMYVTVIGNEAFKVDLIDKKLVRLTKIEFNISMLPVPTIMTNDNIDRLFLELHIINNSTYGTGLKKPKIDNTTELIGKRSNGDTHKLTNIFTINKTYGGKPSLVTIFIDNFNITNYNLFVSDRITANTVMERLKTNTEKGSWYRWLLRRADDKRSIEELLETTGSSFLPPFKLKRVTPPFSEIKYLMAIIPTPNPLLFNIRETIGVLVKDEVEGYVIINDELFRIDLSINTYNERTLRELDIYSFNE